jgi:hypothetical protein
MKLKPFKELIGLSKEKLDEAMAPIRARQVKSQAELELAKLDADILTKETAVQELVTGKTIDFPKLMDKLDEIALLERRKKQYGDVLDQLFPGK